MIRPCVGNENIGSIGGNTCASTSTQTLVMDCIPEAFPTSVPTYLPQNNNMSKINDDTLYPDTLYVKSIYATYFDGIYEKSTSFFVHERPVYQKQNIRL